MFTNSIKFVRKKSEIKVGIVKDLFNLLQYNEI